VSSVTVPVPELEAVVSLLDEAHDAQVRRVWAELERHFGLQGIYGAPYPHFSYHSAQDYPDDAVEALLQQVSRVTLPFTVRTSGLGVFSGPKPIVYVPIVRNPALEACHKALYATLSTLAIKENTHYHPDTWLPHITLAYGDLDARVLPEVMRFLGERNFDWQVRVQNLALVYTRGQEQGIARQVQLGA
jgi:2'-5' RNA ligase